MLRLDELERLSRHLAHELTPGETAQLERELSQSAELREGLLRMEALASLTDEVASAEDARLDAAIERAVGAVRPAVPWRALVAGSVAASI